MLLCRGQGLEPHIEFDRNLVEFGPVLPHSAGDEQEIVIRNPCKFPIEVYNLEFDKTFLEEEKILRLMKGYDEFNTILLPPRGTGDKLPPELLDYYQGGLTLMTFWPLSLELRWLYFTQIDLHVILLGFAEQMRKLEEAERVRREEEEAAEAARREQEEREAEGRTVA